MPRPYNSYSNIQEDCIQLFEHMWMQHTPLLPPIITAVQNEENVKASVFHVWIHYAKTTPFLFIKKDRQLLHAYDTHLIQRLHTYLWTNQHLQQLFQQHKQNDRFLFTFAYFLSRETFKLLDTFVQQHTQLRTIDLQQYPYYYWSDQDIEQHNDIYVVMKYLHAEFLHQFLSEGRIKAMSISVYRQLIAYEKEADTKK